MLNGFQIHVNSRFVPVVVIDEDVPEDREDPSLEVRSRPELVEVLEGAEVGLLDQVLGVGGATCEVQCQTVEAIHVV